MDGISNKTIYYVSNVGTNTIYIIDGETWRGIKEIELGEKPCKIEIDGKKNIYIATDKIGKFFFVNSDFKVDKSFNMPNTGHIKVDFESKRIYVSNTDELCVYSLYDGKVIKKIYGFIAIGDIELSKDGSKIFVLDTIENEIKVYDTIYFKLIKTYKEAFFSTKDILISNNDRYMYVLGKDIEDGSYSYSIIRVFLNNGVFSNNNAKLGLKNDENFNIKFPIGSIITYLVEGRNYLYAVNRGLKKIDVIDSFKNKIIKSFKTTLRYPQKIKICVDEKYLLATSIDGNGLGALDLINIKTGEIERTFNFTNDNFIPCDIQVIENDDFKNMDIADTSSNRATLENTVFDIKKEYRLNKKLDIKSRDSTDNIGSFILTKKIVSTYKEKVVFKKEKVELISEDEVEIKEINFDKCIIFEESKGYIRGKRNYIVFEFQFYIPYYINYITLGNEEQVLKGKLKGKQKAILYTFDNYALDEFEFQVKSLSRGISTPYVKENIVTIDVSSIISTYMIKDDIVFIPSRYANSYMKEGSEC